MEKIHLQFIGEVKAITANNLKVGDITIWNSGYKEKILSITPSKSGKSAVFGIQCLNSGYIGKRRLSYSTLVGIDI